MTKKEIKYSEHQYEERSSIFNCPKCKTIPMIERWLKYVKRLDYTKTLIPRKNAKPVSVWCPKCKFVLSDIKQPKQNDILVTIPFKQ